jgi:hypothetical protein
MLGGSEEGSHQRIDLMTWETVETEVRKMVMELLSPIIRQNTDHKSAISQYGKMLLENKNRIDTLEVAVFHADKKRTAFDEINEKLESKCFTSYI